MSFCKDKGFKIGNFCISNEDYIIILLNILVGIVVGVIFYSKIILNKSNNMSVLVKHNFTPLGEGPLANFYSTSVTQQKNVTTKKKLQTKSTIQNLTVVEKPTNNNELKCNVCSRSVEVSYQFTMPKIQSVAF